MKKWFFVFTITIAFTNWSHGSLPMDLLHDISAKLHDGRTIDFKKDVEEVHFWDAELDYIQLLNGEVLVPMDIKSLKKKKPQSLLIRASNDIRYGGGIGGGW